MPNLSMDEQGAFPLTSGGGPRSIGVPLPVQVGSSCTNGNGCSHSDEFAPAAWVAETEPVTPAVAKTPRIRAPWHPGLKVATPRKKGHSPARQRSMSAHLSRLLHGLVEECKSEMKGSCDKLSGSIVQLLDKELSQIGVWPALLDNKDASRGSEINGLVPQAHRPAFGIGNDASKAAMHEASSKAIALQSELCKLSENNHDWQFRSEADKSDDGTGVRRSKRCSYMKSHTGISSSARTSHETMRTDTWTTNSTPTGELNAEVALARGWRKSKHSTFRARDPSVKYAPGSWRARLHALVSSQAFDGICSKIIILNAVTLGMSVNYSASHFGSDYGPPDKLPPFYEVTDNFFTVWFIFELLLRMLASGRQFLSSENWSWNVFDFIVVSTDVLERVFALIASSTDSSIRSFKNFTAIRVLRVLRVARAIRVIRLIRFFRELRMMVFSILRSGRTLMWSMILLTIVIYIFAIYLTAQVTVQLWYEEDLDVSQLALRHRFGTITDACLTLYMCVAGGISWVEVGDPLVALHWTHGVVLSFFTFFAIFAVMNIITGIFVDTAINAAQNDRDEVIADQMMAEDSTLWQIQMIFQEADTDASGEITQTEFEEHLDDKRVRAHLTALGLQVDEVRGLFQLLDLDRSGSLTIDEFVCGIVRMKGSAKSIDLATLMYENRRMSEKWHRFFLFVELELQQQRRIQEKMSGCLCHLSGATLDEQSQTDLTTSPVLTVKPGKAMPSKVLKVAIISAQNLLNKDYLVGEGVSDPYCICRLHGKLQSEWKTATQYNNLSPTWDSTFYMREYAVGDELEFKVLDKDTWKQDDLLGEVVMPSAMFYPQGFDGSLPLTRHGHKGSCGDLTVSVKLIETDMPLPQCAEHKLKRELSS